jgi:hypothetical protein
MSCPAAKLDSPDRDAIAPAVCARCRRCTTLEVQVAPDGTIYEWRRPRGGDRDVMLVYEPDDALWLAELTPIEAAEAFERAA